MKEKDWSFYLRHCRHRVPPRDQLLERFDKAVEQFGSVLDSESGEPLLRPAGKAAVDRLRKHIAAGCLGDPDGVAMYYSTGKTQDGLATFRCVRGTNATEYIDTNFCK